MPDEDGDKRYTRLVKGIHILHVGRWDSSTGPFDATEKRVVSAFESMENNQEKGIPTTIKYTHSQGVAAVGIGTIKAIYKNENNFITADIVIDEDARVPAPDGNGKITVATIDEIANGLETKKMHTSIEGKFNYKSRGYFGDRVMPLIVNAVAVLPPGVRPAVPSEIAAEEDIEGTSVVLFGELEMENKMAMTIEQAIAKIEAMDEIIKNLQEENKKLKESGTKAEEKKTEAEKKVTEMEEKEAEATASAQKDEVKAKMEVVEKRILAGDREKFRERIEAHDSPAIQLAVLKDFEDTLPEITAEMEVLLSGGESENTEEKTNEDKIMEGAATIQAEAEKQGKTIMLGAAVSQFIEANPDLVKPKEE